MIKAVINYHNLSRPPIAVHKVFELDRDLVANPIVVGEELHLDDKCAANFVVREIYTSEPLTIVTLIPINTDEKLKAAEAVNDGWILERG